jgi:hypothetical protein
VVVAIVGGKFSAVWPIMFIKHPISFDGPVVQIEELNSRQRQFSSFTTHT